MKTPKILIFSFSFIGDAVLSTAVIQPLRKQFPEAHLTFLVGPRAQSVLEGDLQIDTVLVYDNRGVHSGIWGKYRLIKALRRENFDLVLDLRDSFWARFIGAKRWGIVRGRNLHAATRYLDTLNRHGVATSAEVLGFAAGPMLTLSMSERNFADEFLRERGVVPNELLVGIHPGGNWIYKLWPAENFVRIGDILISDFHTRVLLFSGPDEQALQEKVAAMMKYKPIIVNEPSLRRVAALINRCHLYLGNDTGTTHIAAAVGTPVVAIFGSTSHIRSGPYGAQHQIVRSDVDLGCNPCHPGKNPGGCQKGRCQAMEAVTIEQVLSVVRQFIAVAFSAINCATTNEE
ncbi:glycosyltransferase family 9 protein [Candidatus Poribacteria bacterium]|nr:glycosyltransferase family 9 protein [Candidatus Poribacteria bacterium]